ncbi:MULTISPECIES: hypothetical protein [unclassified Pseudoalteromonas]|uniref:hypothetical protein n=1 Tax=unclassified Pseudoalteromonas TaxID=194690 RepID=UPI0018CCD23B|nr:MULTISPECIES: hypothetical protein [unclassified Pseudoalteromonas]MBH0052161.1 hypothetical protein [Pseudoalteromonas sp. SWYJZ19]MBH0077555.1 hypothetical protein [Pseudoalteromonas sp. SWYJ118]
MINTEQVSELRPPKKPTNMGKYYRKVDVNYDNLLGEKDEIGADGRYYGLLLMGSMRDTFQKATVALMLTFFGILTVMQILGLFKAKSLQHFLDSFLFHPLFILGQVLLLIIAFIYHRKAKIPRATSVVFDRKTGNVNFPAFGGNPELVIPFEEVEMYRGSLGFSLGRGMPVTSLIPKKYPKHGKRDCQYIVAFADSYDQACNLWTLLNEYMDKNKPIPYAMLPSVQYYLDKGCSTVWKGDKIGPYMNNYQLDPEIKNNYKYVFHTDIDGEKKYPMDDVNYVIAPFSDDPELLEKNIKRAYELNILLL